MLRTLINWLRHTNTQKYLAFIYYDLYSLKFFLISINKTFFSLNLTMGAVSLSNKKNWILKYTKHGPLKCFNSNICIPAASQIKPLRKKKFVKCKCPYRYDYVYIAMPNAFSNNWPKTKYDISHELP